MRYIYCKENNVARAGVRACTRKFCTLNTYYLRCCSFWKLYAARGSNTTPYHTYKRVRRCFLLALWHFLDTCGTILQTYAERAPQGSLSKEITESRMP